MYEAECRSCGWIGALSEVGKKWLPDPTPFHNGGEGDYPACPFCKSTDVDVTSPEARAIEGLQ